MSALERLRAVLCAPDGEVVIDGTDADRSIVAEALKELDAALSQTAGVPDGWKLVPVEPTAAMCDAMRISVGDGIAMKPVYRAMLAAAPAASGVHPDALPDGTLSKSTGKRVEALAGASVSERAREWFDAYDNAVSDLFADEETGWNEGNRRHWMRRRIDRLRSILIAALEQALTQQRGHGEAVDRDAWAEALELPEGYTVEEFLPGGWHYAWTRTDGERMVSGTTWNHPALAAIAAWQYAPATTHQPSADAVRELVKRWRDQDARKHSAPGDRSDCADELESLLSAASDHQQNAAQGGGEK